MRYQERFILDHQLNINTFQDQLSILAYKLTSGWTVAHLIYIPTYLEIYILEREA